MNRFIGGSLIFLSGTAIGACGTYFLLKNKYEKYANEEIEKCRFAYDEMKKDWMAKHSSTTEKKKVKKAASKKEEKEYEKAITPYNTISKKKILDKKELDEDEVISSSPEEIETTRRLAPKPWYPDDFGSDGFQDVELYYYNMDDSVVDDEGNDFPDWELHLGNFSNVIGQYEPGVAYIRNTYDKIDYRITVLNNAYSSSIESDAPLDE